MRICKGHYIALILIILIPPARADYHYASHQGSNEYPQVGKSTLFQARKVDFNETKGILIE
jgi:hypothetical protein